MMKTPMIVTWHAHRSGVAEKRAEDLWREAVNHATLKTGWVGTPEYYAAAVERFRELMELEAPQAYAAHNIVPLVRAQNRAWMMPLVAFQATAVIVARTWNKLATLRAA